MGKGCLGLRDLTTGKDAKTFKAPFDWSAFPAPLIVSSNGNWAAVGSHIFDAKSGEEVPGYGGVKVTVISPDSQNVAYPFPYTEYGIMVLETLTFQRLYSLNTGMPGPMVWRSHLTVRYWPPRATMEALVFDMTGRLQNGRLQPVELTSPEMETLWKLLVGDDACAAQKAAWTLFAAGGRSRCRSSLRECIPFRPRTQRRSRQSAAA